MADRDRDIILAEKIASMASRLGGTAYYVGGFVRDRLRHEENKDVDIEVHGIYPRQLEEVLDSLGERISVGESFGIYALKGFSLDIAMPRREDSRGSGHRDFDVCVDPFIGTYKAALRRDFTFNALMQEILTGRIVDHFGGAEDIKNGVVRHVSGDTFAEDPLRVLRAAQFAARFGYTVCEETAAICRGMDISDLSRERVMGETEKALLKSARPSVFFETLRGMGRLSEWFPELEGTVGVAQDPGHHPEGDVWTHTMLVLDAAAAYRDRVKDPLGFMLAALTHDLGKAVCTRETGGKLHAYGHETQGLPLIRAFLGRLTSEKGLTRYVLNLAEYHMKPGAMAAAGSSVKATNRMFDLSADPEALVYLSVCDSLGKGAAGRSPEAFLTQRLEVFREYMARPFVTGRDLAEAGVEPSRRYSEYLEFAHKLRLAGVDKEDALRQTLALARKKDRRGGDGEPGL